MDKIRHGVRAARKHPGYQWTNAGHERDGIYRERGPAKNIGHIFVCTNDMSDFGFDDSENRGGDSENVENDDYNGELPEEPTAKPGDVYALGVNRLICGDSTDVNVIDKLLDGNKADLLLTDPPYGINADKGIKTTYGTCAKNKYKYNGDWDNETIGKEAFDYFRLLTAHQIIFGANYFTDKLPIGTHWIVWDKVGDINFNNPFSDCELAWSNYEKVITKKYTKIQQGFVRDEKEKRVHPTQKPVDLLKDILKDYTNEDESVLDVFGGSGSTLIACEELGRKCFICELDPHYVDVIINRWEKFTGRKAELLTQ